MVIQDLSWRLPFGDFLVLIFLTKIEIFHFHQLHMIVIADCSLHWTILPLFYAHFLQWSIIATKLKSPSPPYPPISSAQTIIYTRTPLSFLPTQNPTVHIWHTSRTYITWWVHCYQIIMHAPSGDWSTEIERVLLSDHCFTSKPPQLDVKNG